MSSKKSKKFVNIMLTALMLMAGSSVESYAEYGVNGVSYILLPNETDNPGVFRLNDKDGSNADPWKLFTITNLTKKGKVSGLSANQENKVFLLTANAKSDDDYVPAAPGWMPSGLKFKDDDPIYIAAAGPSDGGASKYIRSGCPHEPYYSSFPANDSSLYRFWYENVTLNGKKYKYVCRFNGPAGVRYLDGNYTDPKHPEAEITCGTADDRRSKKVRGTPIWDGTVYSASNPDGAILHPYYNDSTSKHYKKVIIPSHFGVLSYYLYGTRNEKAIEGKCMNGEDDPKEKFIFTDAAGSGYYTKKSGSKHNSGSMFGCIVRRFYDKRESGLDLYSKDDTTVSPKNPQNVAFTSSNLDKANVLKTVDIKIREAYGKLCGDNCIDGGELEGGPVSGIMSTVTVVTTTKGNRYGFNPLGERYGSICSNKIDAALRVVPYSGGEDVIDIAADKDGKKWGYRITNTSYLDNEGVTPSTVSCIGVSSNFNGDDYIYGSSADYFVVQDSWWGMGGIAYEYYKPDIGKTGFVRKIDYMNKANQKEYTDLGDVDGDLDAIGIDGNGYFYTLVTEKEPSDDAMKSLTVPSGKPGSVGGLAVDYSEWRRDKFKTVGDEKINDGYEVITDMSKLKKGDYQKASVKQKIYKTVYRYGISNGTTLNASAKERVGKKRLLAGYDTWINNLTCQKDKTPDNVSFSYDKWQESTNPDEKVSNVPCELAVVNIADSPINIPGTDNHYVVVTGAKDSKGNNKSYVPGTVYGEHDKVTFKVEGYKPKIGGVQRQLQSVGDIRSDLKNVYINNIPGETFLNGRYEHDEDNDGMYSGFPSTMFEATNKPTKVTWKIAQVEDTVAPSSISSAKVIKYLNDLPDGGIKQGLGINKFADLEYQFKDPGRYLVQATVEYNIFTNYGKASRPDQLTCGKASFVTKPRLITVYANSLALDRTESYITDISFTVENNFGNPDAISSGKGVKEESCNAAEDPKKAKNYTFDTAEGDKYPGDDPNRHFGKLTVSFNAQFVRSDNEGTTSDMSTSDGIGVWDYSYYRNFYRNKAKDYGLNLLDPFTELKRVKDSGADIDSENIYLKAQENHVYNYNGSGFSSYPSLTSSYKVDVYNPGKKKEVNNTIWKDAHEVGTEVDKVKDMDKAFIQWAIYIRPITPQDEDGSLTDAMFPRGECIASGTCVNATFVPNGLVSNLYGVSFEIDDIDSKINVPRDPKNYTLDFEIVYPRVTWLNNQLRTDPKGGDVYYSSMVPWVDGGSSPVHVLSRTILGPNSEDNWVNQNSKGVFTNAPVFVLNVRDKTKPQYEDKTGNVTRLPYFESTGDKIVDVGTFSYRISDNNPFMQFCDSIPEKQKDISPIKDPKDENVKDGLKLYIQKVNSLHFVDLKSAKKYEKAKSVEDGNKITISQTCNGGSDASSVKTWYMHDDYELAVEYKNTVEKLSSFAPYSNYDRIYDQKGNKIIDKIDKANWVGTLNYAVAGTVYDGWGTDPKGKTPTKVLHGLYEDALAADIALTKPKDIISTGLGQNYMERIDNDPPSIGVTLISQNDNRKWQYQLLEGVGDNTNYNDRKKTQASELKDCELIINGYELQSADPSPISGSEYDKVEANSGSTNYYVAEDGKDPATNKKAIGKTTIECPSSGSSLASFKHSSRMLVNVDIFDNCGFKNLDSASIRIVDNLSGVLLNVEDIDLRATHDDNGSVIKKYKDEPRAIFAVDLPRKVAPESEQPQLKITVSACDNAGNEKHLVIPVTILESSFDARVLEHKESKQ